MAVRDFGLGFRVLGLGLLLLSAFGISLEAEANSQDNRKNSNSSRCADANNNASVTSIVAARLPKSKHSAGIQKKRQPKHVSSHVFYTCLTDSCLYSYVCLDYLFYVHTHVVSL